MKEQQVPKPPIVRSLEALTRNPDNLVSVEIARISFKDGGVFSGYAVNSDPRSTLYTPEGKRFEPSNIATRRSVDQEDLLALLGTGRFELVPTERGFHVFPLSSIED